MQRPPVEWFRGDGSYTKASRKPSRIKQIVIHATDGGSYTGNVWWLSGGHSHASAHYVVARDGHACRCEPADGGSAHAVARVAVRRDRDGRRLQLSPKC